MPKYGVPVKTSAFSIVYVEADSPEDALERVWDEGETPWLCAQCSGWGSHNNSGIELGDWDIDDDDDGPIEVD